MRTRTITLALLLTMLAACGEEQPPGADPFGSGTWQLAAGTVDGSALVISGRVVTLRLENGQVGGTSACNSYGGPFTIDQGRVTIGALFMTEMWCEGAMDLESAYLAALARVTTASRDGEALILTGEGVELRFEPQPEEPDAALIGTTWALETITDADAASTPVAPATLVFAADGSVSGSTGCNSFFGDYAAGTGFGPLGSTKMACEPAVMEQEALILGMLGPDATVTIDGSLLTVADLEGRTLVFRAG